MNYNLIIQTLKSQLHGMKLQIDNIEIQNNNMMMGMNGIIVEQLLNLSIQIINVGIQVFISEINKIINNNKYYDQLKVASEQINIIVNSYIMQHQMFMNSHDTRFVQGRIIDNQMQKQNQSYTTETEIKIKFNKRGSITEIKMKAGSMIAELLLEYYEKTGEQGPFKYKGNTLKPDDCSNLLDNGMQNGDEIIVG